METYLTVILYTVVVCTTLSVVVFLHVLVVTSAVNNTNDYRFYQMRHFFAVCLLCFFALLIMFLVYYFHHEWKFLLVDIRKDWNCKMVCYALECRQNCSSIPTTLQSNPSRTKRYFESHTRILMHLEVIKMSPGLPNLDLSVPMNTKDVFVRILKKVPEHH